MLSNIQATFKPTQSKLLSCEIPISYFYQVPRDVHWSYRTSKRHWILNQRQLLPMLAEINPKMLTLKPYHNTMFHAWVHLLLFRMTTISINLNHHCHSYLYPDYALHINFCTQPLDDQQLRRGQFDYLNFLLYFQTNRRYSKDGACEYE